MTEKIWLSGKNLLGLDGMLETIFTIVASRARGLRFVAANCAYYSLDFEDRTACFELFNSFERYVDRMMNDQIFEHEKKKLAPHWLYSKCPHLRAVLSKNPVPESLDWWNDFLESIANRNATSCASIESARSWIRTTCLELLYDIFDNPFRPVVMDSRRLTTNVVDLATAIYHEHAFVKMPILADALIDAGCDNEQIIAHCRCELRHVRGCWVIDSILNNEQRFGK